MKYLALMLAGLVLGACASLDDAAIPPPIDDTPTVTGALANVPRSGLGPQHLQPDECGLFLWSKTDASKFIFFSKALSAEAVMSLANGPAVLTQTGAGGEIFGQFNTRSSYTSETGTQVSLMLVPGREVEGGQRIASGLLTVTNDEGWQTKLPVLGVRACQSE